MDGSSQGLSSSKREDPSQKQAQFSFSRAIIPFVDLTECCDSPPRMTHPVHHLPKRKKRPPSIDTSFRGPLKHLVNEQKTSQRKETEKSEQVLGNESSNQQINEDSDRTPTIAQPDSAASKLKSVPIAYAPNVSPPPLTAIWNPTPTLSIRKHPRAFADAAELLKALPASNVESAKKFRRGSHPADRVAVALVAAKSYIEAQAQKLVVFEGQKLMLQEQANLHDQQSQAWKNKYLECNRKYEELEVRFDDYLKRGGQTKARLDLIRSVRKIQVFGSSQGPKGGLSGWAEDKSRAADVLLSTSNSLGTNFNCCDETVKNSQADEKSEPIVWSEKNLLQNLQRLSRDRNTFTEKPIDVGDLRGSSKTSVTETAANENAIDLHEVIGDDKEEGEITEDDLDGSDSISVETNSEDDDLYLPCRSETPCPPPRQQMEEDTISKEVIRAAQFGTRTRRGSHKQPKLSLSSR